MLKTQIDEILSQQKLNSISDIVHFVIQQVSKSVNFDPLEQIHYRLVDLQKPKGLDTIMIEEVKTIVEAMLDQRQFSMRNDIDRNINDHFQKVETIIQKNISTNSRCTLAQLDILNFQNTRNSRQNINHHQNKHIFASQKNFQLDERIQNLYNDQFSTKKQLKDQKKDLQQLKMNLMSLQKNVSEKVNLEQTQKLMTRFQLQIFQKMNKQKIQWQKFQYKMMKQINSEMLEIRKQIKNSPVFQQISDNTQKLKQKVQKYQKKLKKLSQQCKNSGKIVHDFQSKILTIQNKQTQFKGTLIQSQKQIKKIQNDTLEQIAQLQEFLQDISQKLNFFSKIEHLNAQTNNLKLQIEKIKNFNVRGLWSTQMKLKNSMICWQEQRIHHQNFKFQTHKSQILVEEPGLYQFLFNINQSKNTKNSFVGLILVSSQPNEKYEIKSQVKSGMSLMTKFIQIRQRSFISIKVDQNEVYSGTAYFQIKRI